MTGRQLIMRWIYPWLMRNHKDSSPKRDILYNKEQCPPVESFYQLTTTDNRGQEIRFSDWQGKKILLVNTASDCGYTHQYEELQQLYEQYRQRLIIVGFPANDFKKQEPGTDEDIARFCQVNYGVTFPLATKSSVVKGSTQNPVFQWLTDPTRNGWNSRQPDWNFNKYLVNEQGLLVNFFGTAISPLDERVRHALDA